MHATHHWRLIVPQLRRVGQILRIMPDEPAGHDRTDDEYDRARSE
ncbi:hypothetical protein BIWAKO_04722 [Bosea sp. BIWAKO-01]|nr:hypothetical protein BIWAKO_04722 [Bosea sp. BIWAKO-01]